jgi:predicted kinase
MFLLQMSGVPGSGKSTVAAHVARTFGAVAVDYDVIKSAILDAGFDLDSARKASYEVMYAQARHVLTQGHPVIMDSPCFWPRIITEGMKIAHDHNAAYRFIECQIEDLQLLNTRLAQRPRLRTHRPSINQPPPDAGDTPEDGEPLFRTWMTRTQHPPTPYLQLNMHDPLPKVLPQVDTYLQP